MRPRQSMQFPPKDPGYRRRQVVSVALMWLLAGWGAWVLYWQCWALPRQGSQLLNPASVPSDPWGELLVLSVFCGISIVEWLVSLVSWRPPGRGERQLLAAWLPPLVLGVSLVFLVSPLSRRAGDHARRLFEQQTRYRVRVIAGSDKAPSAEALADLGRRVRRALPRVDRDAWFIYQRPARRLRYPHGLSFELDDQAGLLRVRRDGTVDSEATARYQGHGEAQIIARAGTPEHRDVLFAGPWRLVYTTFHSRLVYEPSRGRWQASDGMFVFVVDDEDVWRFWRAP